MKKSNISQNSPSYKWPERRRSARRLHGWIYDIRTGRLKKGAKNDGRKLPRDIVVYDFPDEPEP